MSVWFAIPSKKPAAEAEKCLSLWRDQGYRLAIWRDTGDDPVRCDLTLTGAYPGYSNAVNALCKEILSRDLDADWIVTGGDDMEPDPIYGAVEIGEQCSEHFAGTFGVMQPTGDRWGEDDRMPNVRPDRKAYADRVCGSPWLGAEFCRRMYGGKGPLWHGYTHMYQDEELQEVAERHGILWQRRDLVHFHRHWAREGRPMPTYLRTANAEFGKYGRIFQERKASRFPGHEPLSVEAIMLDAKLR